MDKDRVKQQLGIIMQSLQQDPYWREEFRKIDEWKQGIRDLHGREPTDDEMSWYYDTQGPE